MTSQLEKNFDDIKKSLKSNRINHTFDADPTAPRSVRRFVATHNAREAKEATANILRHKALRGLKSAAFALSRLTEGVERKKTTDPDLNSDPRFLVANRADQIKNIVDVLKRREEAFSDWRNGSVKQSNLILSLAVAVNDGVLMLQKELFQLADEIDKRNADGDEDGEDFCREAVDAIIRSFEAYTYANEPTNEFRRFELYLVSWSFTQAVDAYLKWFEPIPEELQYAATK